MTKHEIQMSKVMKIKYRLTLYYVPDSTPMDPMGGSRVVPWSKDFDGTQDIYKFMRELQSGVAKVGNDILCLGHLFSLKIERIQTSDITKKILKMVGLRNWEP